MKLPRILLAAGASGSGKTLITCGLLQAFVNRGISPASFKCGPDYIDPMFHSRVIGTKSRNLDTFFTTPGRTRYLLGSNGADCDLAVMEGVMGYYDGVGGTTVRASAFDLAEVTDTPVILIVNSRGMSASLAAYVKGFLEYQKDSHIRGVILNQMSPMLYPRMKKLLEEQLGVKVLGYVPKVEDCVIESRHLGLVLPEEIQGLKERLRKMAEVLEDTLDLEGILALASEAPELDVPEDLSGEDEAFAFRVNTPFSRSDTLSSHGEASFFHAGERLQTADPERPLRVGLAKDEAFCFFYEDNFRLLREMGAELIPFSPIHDRELPEDLDGLLLYGGYPELKGKELEENRSMRESVKTALKNGMPCMAECGGFMYLHETMEGMDGSEYHMAGVIAGKTFPTSRLARFGYITLSSRQDPEECGPIPAHEFHYYDSENCGEDYYASRPLGGKGWNCIHDDGRLMAGFPHLYYYGNPGVAVRFLKRCLEYRTERRGLF